MASGTPTIIAYATEDGRLQHVADAAVAAASKASARLIFYDIDAPSAWKDILPGDEMEAPDGDLLEAASLEEAGLTNLARQVESARSHGVEAFAWLPTETGAEELGRYAEMQGASMVMLPGEMVHPSLMDRLRGRSLAPLEDMSDAPIVIVHRNGESEILQPISRR
jgi:hypothetical protein